VCFCPVTAAFYNTQWGVDQLGGFLQGESGNVNKEDSFPLLWGSCFSICSML